MVFAWRAHMLNETLNTRTETIIGAAIDVRRELGPGLLEQSYEACLTFELLQRVNGFPE
jgi:GxxExxY protein